jgi:hypothetical protein
MKSECFFCIVTATSASLSMLPTACRSDPCAYGGTCVTNLLTSNNDSYQCQCTPGRIGINCEHREYNIRMIMMVLLIEIS